MYRIGDREISSNVVDGPFGSQLKADEYEVDGVALIRVSNCRTGEILIDDELVYISEEKHKQLIRSEVLPDDVLVTKAGHILGYSAVFPKVLKKGNITSHLAAVRPTKTVDSLFLSFFLSSSIGNRQIYRWGNKATRPELNTDEVREILIPRPPLPLQHEMVAQMERARESRRHKLEQANALLFGLDAFLLACLGLKLPPSDNRFVFGARLSDITNRRLDAHFYRPYLRKTESAIRSLGCDIVDLGSLLRDPPLNGLDARTFTDEGRRYIRVQNIRPFDLSFDDVKYVTVETEKDISLASGDVLLTRKGTYGVAAVVQPDATGCLISSEVILLHLRHDSSISVDFLVAWINSTVCQTLLSRYKSGGIMGHLTQDVVEAIPVPVPDKAIQNDVAAEVTRRRLEARLLREEAVREWKSAKTRFEAQLLGGEGVQ